MSIYYIKYLELIKDIFNVLRKYGNFIFKLFIIYLYNYRIYFIKYLSLKILCKINIV